MSRKKTFDPMGFIWGILIAVLVALAVREQLSLPPEERTWYGKVGGIVPYDFRVPTMERIRATYWNEESAEILVPQVFGVGWTVNLYPLLHPKNLPRLS